MTLCRRFIRSRCAACPFPPAFLCIGTHPLCDDTSRCPAAFLPPILGRGSNTDTCMHARRQSEDCRRLQAMGVIWPLVRCCCNGGTRTGRPAAGFAAHKLCGVAAWGQMVRAGNEGQPKKSTVARSTVAVLEIRGTTCACDTSSHSFSEGSLKSPALNAP